MKAASFSLFPHTFQGGSQDLKISCFGWLWWGQSRKPQLLSCHLEGLRHSMLGTFPGFLLHQIWGGVQELVFLTTSLPSVLDIEGQDHTLRATVLRQYLSLGSLETFSFQKSEPELLRGLFWGVCMEIGRDSWRGPWREHQSSWNWGTRHSQTSGWGSVNPELEDQCLFLSLTPGLGWAQVRMGLDSKMLCPKLGKPASWMNLDGDHLEHLRHSEKFAYTNIPPDLYVNPGRGGHIAEFLSSLLPSPSSHCLPHDSSVIQEVRCWAEK